MTFQSHDKKKLFIPKIDYFLTHLECSLNERESLIFKESLDTYFFGSLSGKFFLKMRFSKAKNNKRAWKMHTR